MNGPKRRRYIDPYNLEFYPEGMTLGDMLQRLAVISPDDIDAFTVLVDHTLRRRWITLVYPSHWIN